MCELKYVFKKFRYTLLTINIAIFKPVYIKEKKKETLTSKVEIDRVA